MYLPSSNPNTTTLISLNTTGTFAPSAPLLTTIKRKGWPERHCRRQGWYRSAVMKIFYRLGQPAIDNTMNPSAKPWSDHEIETFDKVREMLAELYNNRFGEYHKMITEEKGLEYFPEVKINKFILK